MKEEESFYHPRRRKRQKPRNEREREGGTQIGEGRREKVRKTRKW